MRKDVRDAGLPAKVEREARPEGLALWLPKPGELVAERFVIEEMAGSGGMGTVFKARDLRAGGPVAIKVVSRSRHDAFERFAREAQLLSELSHPAIVRYVAHGPTARGAQFLAMEWLDGDDLAGTLSRAPLSPTQSIALLRRVCEGTQLAHGRGIVHRDLKPSNLFVVGGDVTAVKVLDFGLARRSSSTHTLTRGGTVLGTVGYMAPEQAMGMFDVDARSDVFSLGCVLFECLTGRAAFFARHDVAVLAKVLRDEPPRVSDLRPELGGDFDELVSSMLAKDRFARPRDAGEVLSALDALTQRATLPHSVSLPVVSHLTASERRIVSIILARTKVAPATLPPTGAERVVGQLMALAKRFDADSFPLQGDGLLLSLSGHDAATDQACRAASCALALKRLRPDLDVAVTTGGLEHSGSVPVGDAIDRAAVLLEAAVPLLGVSIDELTHGLLDGRFDVQLTQRGPLLLGELDDVELPRLLLSRATPCVGRDKELGLLEATFEECANDSVSRCVLVTGVPGIGKSRLARAFLDRMRSHEIARIVVARADAIAAGSALSLLQRLLRRAAGLRSADSAELQRQGLREYLSTLRLADSLDATTELIAELVDLEDALPPSPLLRAARNDPEVMHAQLRKVFEQWLAAEAALRPVVLLLEDLHWADAPSVSYLEHALGQLHASPILVVALGRPDVRERFPRLQNLSGLQEIRLSGLTRRAAERLARTVLHEHDDATIARIVERADGNAFYLEELIRRVAERSSELPVTVLAMAQSRLERLELDARRVLRAASVFGGVCSARGVSVLLGDQCDERGWLEALVQREILVRRRDPRLADDPEYEFRHALLRDAAYAMLTDADRRVAHRIAGYWLEREGERDALVLADHFERGLAFERAVTWLSQAALGALEAGDFDGALALSERALTLGAAGEQRGNLLLLQGYVAAFRTRADNGRLEEALDLLPRASPHWWLALSTLMFGAVSTQRREDALPYIQLALTTEPGAELSGPYGAALQTLCAAMVVMGRAELAWSVLERYEQVSADDTRSDPLFLAWLDLARAQLATTSPCRGVWQLERALGWARAGATAMRTLGSSHGLATGLFYVGYASRILGLYSEAGQVLRECRECAERSGNMLVAQYARLILTLVGLRDGPSELVLAELGELLGSFDATVAHGAQTMIAEAHYRGADFASARAGACAALSGPSAPYRRVAFSTLARAQLALGQPREALETAEQALTEQDAATPEYAADLLASKVLAARSLGDTEAATQARRAAVTLVERVASGIEDSTLRHSFLSEIEANARVLALDKDL